MSLHGFYAKNIPSRKISYLVEFDETPRFWYPRVARDAWIDFSSQTVELLPLERRENLSFCFSLLSFSFSIRFFFLSLLLASYLFFSVGFSPFLPYPTHPLFVCSPFPFPFHFLFSLIFSYLSFSLLFLFLHFVFSFSPLDCINRMVPKVGNFLPTSSFATCHYHIFLNFFHFSLFSSCDTWLNVSHLSQFAPSHGYHAMCLAPKVPCGIHMVLPCFTRHSMPRKT